MNIEKLAQLKDKNVLVFGDFMVDKYIVGEVSRISPEAPVPVVEAVRESRKLGGAGNVINNIVSLSGKVRVIGCVGKEKEGDFIMKHFSEMGVDTRYFGQLESFVTIIKTRVVSKNQQFLRIDEEKKEPLVQGYYNYLKQNIEEILEDIDVVVISDYAKGAVTYEASQLLIKNARRKGIPVVVDPKGVDYSKYVGATVCTPNMKELASVCNVKLENEEEIASRGGELCKEIELDYLALTRSEKGISLINQDGEKKDFPALAKEVIDVSGAGDTVVAVMALLLALHYEMDEICKIANIAASIVVSKFGTATVTINELICGVSKSGEFKYQDLNTMKYVVNDLKEKGNKVVFTNGCFDMLHIGHLQSFKEAREYGDVLIVAVNSDRSVKENKGDLRPIINEAARIEMVCALECVDYVVLLDEKTPEHIIKELEPDVCVKGEDWKNKKVPERDVIEGYGGKIEFVKLYEGYSTTKIIEKIMKAYGGNDARVE